MQPPPDWCAPDELCECLYTGSPWGVNTSTGQAAAGVLCTWTVRTPSWTVTWVSYAGRQLFVLALMRSLHAPLNVYIGLQSHFTKFYANAWLTHYRFNITVGPQAWILAYWDHAYILGLNIPNPCSYTTLLWSCSHGNTQKLKKAAYIPLISNFKKIKCIVSIYTCYLCLIVCRRTDDGDSYTDRQREWRSATVRHTWVIQKFVKHCTLKSYLIMPLRMIPAY